MKLDDDWPLLSGKKFSEIAALEVEKKLDTVSKDLHYVTQTLTKTKKMLLKKKIRRIGKTTLLYTIFLSKELVLLMKNQGWINSSY